MHPCLMRTQIRSIDVPIIITKGDNNKKVKKNNDKILNLLLQNRCANFNQTWHNAYLDEGDSSLFKWKTKKDMRTVFEDNWIFS